MSEFVSVVRVARPLLPSALEVARLPFHVRTIKRAGLNDAADVALCMAAGELVEVPRTRTIADGLQARLGDLTWPIVRDHVDDVITVEENEIVGGMRLCYERMKVVVEPSGAVGLAAVVGEKFAERHGDLERVGVILCGGNVDLNTRGFWESWRA